MTQPQDQQSLEDAKVQTEETTKAAEGEVVTPPAAEPEAPAPAEPPKPAGVLTDEDKRELNLAIRKSETNVLNPVAYEQSKLVAKDFFESGALPKHLQNPTQAFVTIVTGAEMGLKPMESIQGLYIINGMINLWGKAVPRQLLKHGYKFKYQDENQEQCTVLVWKGKSFAGPEEGDEQYTETFYFKDAEASGYTKDSYGKLKVGWQPGQNRKLKMRYNVLSALIKTYIPDVLGQASDIQEVAQDYIEGEVVTDPKTQARDGIKAALKNRQNGTGPKAAPTAVKQDQGEDEDEES
jgi:hypothetical protein